MVYNKGKSQFAVDFTDKGGAAPAKNGAAQKIMKVNLRPRGVCSRAIQMDVEDGIIHNVNFTGGCAGNTLGLSKLLEGMEAQEAISRLKGVRCGFKPTSCPDQLACGLEEFLAQSKA